MPSPAPHCRPLPLAHLPRTPAQPLRLVLLLDRIRPASRSRPRRFASLAHGRRPAIPSVLFKFEESLHNEQVK